MRRCATTCRLGSRPAAVPGGAKKISTGAAATNARAIIAGIVIVRIVIVRIVIAMAMTADGKNHAIGTLPITDPAGEDISISIA